MALMHIALVEYVLVAYSEVKDPPISGAAIESQLLELLLNLKTARELGLTIQPSVLAIADEVIE